MRVRRAAGAGAWSRRAGGRRIGLIVTTPLLDGRPEVILDVDVRDGLFSGERNPVATFRFVEGWIVKWIGPDLKASGNEVAIETLEIAHEGLELDSVRGTLPSADAVGGTPTW